MAILRKFVDWNLSLCRRFSIKNLSEYGVHVEYLRLATVLFSDPDTRKIIDIACGSNWTFPLPYKKTYQLEISGVDIEQESVAKNNSLDHRFVQDVCNCDRIGDEQYDLITCYSGIEHFSDVEQFLKNAYLSLRPGGALIAQFPSRLGPFALINRLMPQKLKKKMLEALVPEKNDEIGFPVFYNKCEYSQFRAAAERSGFKVEYYLPTFASSDYFAFFFPLFLVSQTVDLVRLIFGTKDMASYNLFILRRPGKHTAFRWSWHADPWNGAVETATQAAAAEVTPPANFPASPESA